MTHHSRHCEHHWSRRDYRFGTPHCSTRPEADDDQRREVRPHFRPQHRAGQETAASRRQRSQVLHEDLVSQTQEQSGLARVLRGAAEAVQVRLRAPADQEATTESDRSMFGPERADEHAAEGGQSDGRHGTAAARDEITNETNGRAAEQHECAFRTGAEVAARSLGDSSEIRCCFPLIQPP